MEICKGSLSQFSLEILSLRKDRLLLYKHVKPKLFDWGWGNFDTNNWRGVTILLRTAGQGHPTSIHTPCPTHIRKNHPKGLYLHFSTCIHWPWSNGLIDGQTDKASERVVHNWKRQSTLFTRQSVVHPRYLVSWSKNVRGNLPLT